MSKLFALASFTALALLTPMIVEAADDPSTYDDPTPPSAEPPGTSDLMTQVGLRWCDLDTAGWYYDTYYKLYRRCYRQKCCDLKSGVANKPSAVWVNCALDFVLDDQGHAVAACVVCPNGDNC